MVNAWIEHVRQYAKENNLTYACAIPYASKTYTKQSTSITNRNNEIKQLEFEMKGHREAYDSYDISNSLSKILSGNRRSGNRNKLMEHEKQRFNATKEKLTALTNIEYPRIPTQEEQKKSQKEYDKRQDKLNKAKLKSKLLTTQPL